MTRILVFLFFSNLAFSEWFGGYDIQNILYQTRDVVFEEVNRRDLSMPFEIKRQLSVIKQRLYKHPWWIGRVHEVNWIKTDIYLFARFEKTVKKYDERKKLSKVLNQLDDLSDRYRKILKNIY